MMFQVKLPRGIPPSICLEISANKTDKSSYPYLLNMNVSNLSFECSKLVMVRNKESLLPLMVITSYHRIGWIMSIFEIVLYFAHLKYNIKQPMDKNK